MAVAKRGRPPEHQPEEYGAVAIYQKHFRMVLRSTEGDTPLVLGKRMDHSTIWWGLQRIPIVYFERALELLYELIDEFFRCEIFFADWPNRWGHRPTEDAETLTPKSSRRSATW